MIWKPPVPHVAISPQLANETSQRKSRPPRSLLTCFPSGPVVLPSFLKLSHLLLATDSPSRAMLPFDLPGFSSQPLCGSPSSESTLGQLYADCTLYFLDMITLYTLLFPKRSLCAS